MLAVISSRYQYGPFLFFVAEVMSNYLTTDGLKKISLLPEAKSYNHNTNTDPNGNPTANLR